VETISTKQAREHLAEVVNKVTYAGERYTLTRHGHGVAVLISLDEWRAIEALLEKLEDSEDIKDADAAYASYLKEGGIPFSKVKKQFGFK
jgi:prevent-host-death family protein